MASSGSKGESADTDQSRNGSLTRSNSVEGGTPLAGRGADESPAPLSTEGGRSDDVAAQTTATKISGIDLATGDESLPLSEPVALSDASGAAAHLLDAHGFMVDDIPADLVRAA